MPRCVSAALSLFGSLAAFALTLCAAADEPQATARVVPHFGYTQTIEITTETSRAIICPQVGGRVLEFSVAGKDALDREGRDKVWQPGQPSPNPAGRFDYGPELTVTPHPRLWSGDWSGEVIQGRSAKLTSPRDEDAGIELSREFVLLGDQLVCTQSIHNISAETKEVCHWGRSFSPGGGICLVPLGRRPSRFPAKYAMYEESAIINVRNTDDKIRERDGFIEILGAPRKPKLGFDSMAGWVAYLMPNDMMFVKFFKTYPDRVYSEAAGLTLSVWYPGPRIEIEPIGPRERLKPGESATFTETWWLVPFAFPKEGEQVDLGKVQGIVQSQQRAVF